MCPECGAQSPAQSCCLSPGGVSPWVSAVGATAVVTPEPALGAGSFKMEILQRRALGHPESRMSDSALVLQSRCRGRREPLNMRADGGVDRGGILFFRILFI